MTGIKSPIDYALLLPKDLWSFDRHHRKIDQFQGVDLQLPAWKSPGEAENALNIRGAAAAQQLKKIEQGTEADNFMPMEWYPAGYNVRVPEGMEPVVPITPETTTILDTPHVVNYSQGRQEGFLKLMLRSSFLSNVVDAVIQFQKKQKGELGPPENYIVLDLDQANIRKISAKKCNPTVGGNKFFIPDNDINAMLLVQSSKGIMHRLKNFSITVDQARKQIEELRGALNNYQTEKLREIAEPIYKSIRTDEVVFAQLRAKDLHCDDSDFAGGNPEVMSIGALEKSMGESDGCKVNKEIEVREIEIIRDRASLRGIVQAIALHEGMLSLSSGYAYEDDIIRDASQIMAAYGFEDDAHQYAVQARDVSIEVGDVIGALRGHMLAVEFDTQIEDDERAGRFAELLHFVEEELDMAVRSDLYPFGTLGGSEAERRFIESSYEPWIRDGVRKESITNLTDLRAETMRRLMPFVAEKAGSDVEDGVLVFLNTKLDKYIEEAIDDPNITEVQFTNLVSARVTSNSVQTHAAQKSTASAELDDRASFMNEVNRRTDAIEAMYENYLRRHPDRMKNSVVTEAYGTWVVNTHFRRYQHTGHAYDGVIQFFGWLDKHPLVAEHSVAVQEMRDKIREEAPHLFDSGGKLLPLHEHGYAPDANYVGSLVAASKILVGGTGEVVVNDIAGGGIGTGLGFLVAGPPGAAVGFGIGCGGGMVATRASYSDEIQQLTHQAMMVGQKLAVVREEDVNREISLTALFAVVPFFGASSGSRFFINGAKKVRLLASKDGLKYLGREAVREFRTLGRLGLNTLRASRAFLLGRRGLGSGGLRALSTAEAIVKNLSAGRDIGAALKTYEKGLIGHARELLAPRLREALGNGKTVGETAESLARLLIHEGSEAANNLRKFRSLLGKAGRGKIGKVGFGEAMTGIFGEEAEGVTKSLAQHIFNAPDRKGMARALRGLLGSKLEGDPKVYVRTLMAAMDNTLIDEKMIARLAKDLRIVDIPMVLRLNKLLNHAGTQMKQIEVLIEKMLEDPKSLQKLLEGLLRGETQESMRTLAVKEAAKRGARFHGQVIDEYAIDALAKEATQGKLYEWIHGILKSDRSWVSKLADEKVFNNLRKYSPKFDELITEITEGSSRHVTTAKSRAQILEDLIGQRESSDQLVDSIIGKGMNGAKRNRIPGEARDALREAVFNLKSGTPEAQKELMRGARAQVRKKIANYARTRLRHWATTRLADIGDTELRAEGRLNRNRLLEALMMVDDQGEEYLRTVVSQMSPTHLHDFGEHFDAGIKSFRKMMVGEVVGRLEKALLYSPSKGWLDRPLRTLNRVYNKVLLADVLDGFFARRLEAMSLAVRMADDKILFNELRVRKALLREAYNALNIAENGGIVPPVKTPGPVLRAYDQIYGAATKKIFTREFQQAHRLCMPYFAYDFARAQITGESMSFGGMVCGLLFANNMADKFTLGGTGGLDTALAQRWFGIWYVLESRDSEEPTDVQRFGATYLEAMAGVGVQNWWMYGIDVAQKFPALWWLGETAFVRRLSLSYTSRTWFKAYEGSHLKPTFKGIRGYGLTAGMGGAAGASIAYAIKGKKLHDFHPENARQTWWKYIGNGVLVNKPGFRLQSFLKREGSEAGLTSTSRQIFERILGTFTMILWYEASDPVADKAEWRKKEDRLLSSAASNIEGIVAREARQEAVDVYLTKYFWDITSTGSGCAGNGFQFGYTLHPDQWATWFKDEGEPMTVKGGKKMDAGYFVLLARDNPERLEQFMIGVHEMVSNSEASWREKGFLNSVMFGPGEKKSLYYFFLASKYYANKYIKDPKKYPEYRLFLEFVATAPYQDFMAHIPECENFKELREVYKRVEQGGTASALDLGWDLERLMTQLKYPKMLESLEEKLGDVLPPEEQKVVHGHREEFREKYYISPFSVESGDAQDIESSLEYARKPCTRKDPCHEVFYDEETGEHRIIYYFGDTKIPLYSTQLSTKGPGGMVIRYFDPFFQKEDETPEEK